jgi:electron transfer flavoprotein alpha/beta subunit
MPWRIQYRDESGVSVLRFPTPERAIEAACLLLDKGLQVVGIGVGDLEDSIAESEIARIYAMWARAKKPFG